MLMYAQNLLTLSLLEVSLSGMIKNAIDAAPQLPFKRIQAHSACPHPPYSLDLRQTKNNNEKNKFLIDS